VWQPNWILKNSGVFVVNYSQGNCSQCMEN
jgi:hypothetical protein